MSALLGFGRGARRRWRAAEGFIWLRGELLLTQLLERRLRFMCRDALQACCMKAKGTGVDVARRDHLV